jgi:hypothetical protein
MGRIYLVDEKEEIDRRRRLLGPALPVEVWQDLYTPDIIWLGDDARRRLAYGQEREGPRRGWFWMGETSKRALDSVGEALTFLAAVEETAVPVYYGSRLTDVDSLPDEESLKARVLSAHGIGVAWVTYDQFGERNSYEPTAPTDATFFLRRPGSRAAHLWRLFRTGPEAVAFMAEHRATDPEALAWAKHLGAHDFSELLTRFGRNQ